MLCSVIFVTLLDLSCLVVFCRKQQRGRGGHDARMVHVGEQEECTHQETEPALSTVRLTPFYTRY